jgi:hypothetical protein
MRKCFSKAIYLNTLRRYWVGGALLSVIFILVVLGYHSGNRFYTQEILGVMPQQDPVFNIGKALLDLTPGLALSVAAAAVLCAVMVFSYLHNKRGAVMIHAVPVRREAHFVSSFLGGLTLLWGPVFLGAGGFAVVQASLGRFNAPSLGIMLMMLLLTSLGAYCLTVLAGFFTGSQLGQFSVLALILALPLMIEMFISQLAANYLFGYRGGFFPTWINYHLHPAAPLGKLFGRAEEWLPRPAIEHAGGLTPGDAGQIAVLLTWCAVFIAGSLLLYRRRRLECAGDLIAVRGMRPFYRYGAAFLAAYIFGMFGSAFVGDALFGRGGGMGGSGWLPYSIVGGVIGCFLAEMFIRRTVKVWRYWKGALVFTGCYILVILSLMFDIYGYGSYVLPKDRVESVYLSREEIPWPGSAEWFVEPRTYMFSGDDMEAALALQELIAKEGRKTSREGMNWTPPQGHWTENTQFPFDMHYFSLHATLTNGRVVERNYQLYVPRDDAAWNEAIGALDEAARPQSLERLRNIGAAAWRLDFWTNYLYDREDFYASHTAGSLRGRDKTDFIEALILDNDHAPHPHWENRWRGYEPNGMIQVEAIFGRQGSIPIRVWQSDRNAIEWLIANNHLPEDWAA